MYKNRCNLLVTDNVSKYEYEYFMNSSSLGSALSRLDKIHTYRSL